MKAGRKRKTNVMRDKSGKSRGEPLRVDANVVDIRCRQLAADGINARHALDALAGFTLGKLRLRGRDDEIKRRDSDRPDPSSISQAQYEAGEKWSKIVHRHAALMGYSLTTPSPGLAMVGGGRGIGPDPEEETIARIRAEWRKCYDALMEASRIEGAPIWKITYGVAIENWPAAGLTTEDYGHLRTGLNALARVFS